MKSHLRWVLAGLFIVTYNSWVLAPMFNPNPYALGGYLSELAAADQPNNLVFRLADSLTAGLVAVLAVLGVTRWKTWLGSSAKWVSVALMLFGVATFADAIFAMPCASSFDELCKADESAHPFALKYLLHDTTSVLVGVGVVGSLFGVWWGQRRLSLGRAASRIFGFGLLVTLLLLVTIAVAFSYGFGQGYVQIVQVVLTSGWFAWLALRLGEK